MAFGDYGAMVFLNGKRVPSGRSEGGRVHCSFGFRRDAGLFKGYLLVGGVSAFPRQLSSISIIPGETRAIGETIAIRCAQSAGDPIMMALESDEEGLWSAVSGYGIGPEATQWHPIRQKVKTLFALYELAKFKGEWADRLG